MRLRCVVWMVLLSLLPFPQILNAQTISLPISSPNWFFSPYNWKIPGTFHVESLSPAEIVTNQPGAYFTLSFTNSEQALLSLDTLNMPASGGVTAMVVQWRIDDTLYPAHTVALSDTQLLLATNLSIGTHTLQFWVVSSDYHQDRWSKTAMLSGGFLGPAQSLRITGLTLGPGGSLAPMIGLRPKRILFFGDSITEGAGIAPGDDASQTYATVCAQALHAEYGVVAHPGQGWAGNIAPTSGVPSFPTAFNQYYDKTPRFSLTGGTPAPDYVVLNIGTNDSISGAEPARVAKGVVYCLQQIRTFLPNTQIVLVVPFGGFQAQALQSACIQYRQGDPSDTKVRLIDLGETARTGLMGQIDGGSAQSFDGIHPNLATHRALGYQLAAAMQTALGSNDVNGDGKSDLILQNTTSNQVADWFQDNTTMLNGVLISLIPDLSYQIVGSGDFNGDGKMDYVFQNRLTNQIAIWYMNGATVQGGSIVPLTPSIDYKVVAVGDFNGDGKPDFVFQNQLTHQIAFWFMEGTTLIGGAALPQVPGVGYEVVGVGDFNRDGQMDLLFQDTVSGNLVLWFMNGTGFVSGIGASAPPPVGYRVEAIADFDGDGRPDVALRDPLGNIQLWHFDGAKVYSTESVSARLDPAFRIAGPR